MGQARLQELDAQAAAVPAPQRRAVAQRWPRAMLRTYANAKQSRLTVGWNANNTSADSELHSSLTTLRARSRALVRDASYAKRARVLVVNNVIGPGIGLQAQVRSTRGELNKRANSEIEAEHEKWARGDSCHTGGRLGLRQFERTCMAQIFEAGEVLVREHNQKFGNSAVPYALELIEAERIADSLPAPYQAAPGNQVIMGIEVDRFYRPVAYYIRSGHPSDVNLIRPKSETVERVPASEIIHLAMVDRWPQTRGEPWLHAAARRLNDMDGYSEAEITRARVQATSVGAIETSEDSDSWGEVQPDGTVEMEMEPGVYKRLAPGEKLNATSPTAPNPALDPFMRYMLREVASGTGVSYASLSSDYSQSNYSSSRLALLDDRDLWKVLQVWFIDEFKVRVYRHWLRQAVLARAIPSVSVEAFALDMDRYEAARFKPRGWSWIDPTKEVEAYRQAVTAGFMTVSDVVAYTNGGQDLEDVLEARRAELDAMDEAQLKFETSPDFYMAKAAAAAAPAGPNAGGANNQDQAAQDPMAQDQAAEDQAAQDAQDGKDPASAQDAAQPRFVTIKGGKRNG